MCGVAPYIRGTCNPEPGWLGQFLDWWIAEDGYADMSRAGVLRWFVRVNDDIIWDETREGLVARFPGTADAPTMPMSVTFIPASVYDNRVLLAKNPGYLASLQALPLVDRERLLGDRVRGGNWKVKPAAGKVFNRAWFKMVDAVPAGGVCVRSWDFAATEKATEKNDPDYTASCFMARVNGGYYILDVTAEQLPVSRIDDYYTNLTRQDVARCKAEGRRYMSRWEQEPGSAGKRDSWRMTRMMAGIDAKGIPSTGDKLTRAKPLAAQAEAGNVSVLAGAWNDMFLNHMHGQPDLAHDDMMDAATGAATAVMGATSSAINPRASVGNYIVGAKEKERRPGF